LVVLLVTFLTTQRGRECDQDEECHERAAMPPTKSCSADAIHLARAAHAEEGEDFVDAQSSARRERHFFNSGCQF
jgi:hypothetical protein